MTVWRNPASHNTYPGLCREICDEYGLVKDTGRLNSEGCIVAAEKYFKQLIKRMADKCEKDPFKLTKHESLKDLFDAAWLLRRYQNKPTEIQKPVPITRGNSMTVSLFKSTASGSTEIVVQTNAQSLEVFVSSFSDALSEAIEANPENAKLLAASALKNAFPIAFALSGYKAEKVSEARLLTCGFASPDASELLVQSHI